MLQTRRGRIGFACLLLTCVTEAFLVPGVSPLHAPRILLLESRELIRLSAEYSCMSPWIRYGWSPYQRRVGNERLQQGFGRIRPCTSGGQSFQEEQVWGTTAHELR